jgi:hypothetical protein
VNNNVKFVVRFKICSEFALGGVKVVHNDSNRVNSYAVKNKMWVSFESSLMIKKKVRLHDVLRKLSHVWLIFLHKRRRSSKR